MPFRTRDFILFLLMIAFMIVGITTTIKSDLSSKKHQAMVIEFDDSTSSEVAYNAVLPEAPADERLSRLTILSEKIAEVLSSDDYDSPVVEEEVLSATPPEKLPSSTPPTNSVSLCSNYSLSQLNWNPKGLQFEIIEGARILYRETSPEVITTVASGESREVVLQLPLRTIPLSSKTCLKTDVVGIALDGSLIKNNEQAIYKIFNSETLIGYALDGFPIYGLDSSLITDECGGILVSGEYRYYLSPEREGVLGCFSAEPVGF